MKFILLLGMAVGCMVSHLQAQPLNTVFRPHADSALLFCRTHQLDTSFCLLINMGIHSGKNRLVVWDFNRKKVERAGLCCHGMGEGSTADLPYFSNQPGSYCTSLGKYRIGKRAYSRWGIHVHYKLHGLERTNSNAFQRIVVLHSYSEVPSRETYPHHLPLGYSLGCPVVSDVVMQYLDDRLQRAKAPVLLWIYFE